MTVLALAAGSLFAGRYRIIRCIAQGGMGAVYEVIHLETERRRALKVMLPNMLQNAEMQARFRQEARVTANIESEFIVDVFDAGIDEATQMPFLVMEMLRGEELDKKLKRVERFDPAEVVTILQQTSLALDKTHRASIVHRDLKPGNLFLTERDDGSPRIKVLDFGIAKLVAEGATNANATRSLGTPLYMAPEQFQIGQKVTPATDIYALGMIAYTLLVGHPYWADEVDAGANVFSFAAKAIFGPPEVASARAARRGVSLPSAFDAWFARVTATAPENRLQPASAAVRGLAEALGVALGPSRSNTISEVIISPFAQQGAGQRASSSPDIGWSPQGGGSAGSARTPDRLSATPPHGTFPRSPTPHGGYPAHPSSSYGAPPPPTSSPYAAPPPPSSSPYAAPPPNSSPYSAPSSPSSSPSSAPLRISSPDATTTRLSPGALTAMGNSTGLALTSTSPGRASNKGLALALGITLGVAGLVGAATLFLMRGSGDAGAQPGTAPEAAVAVARPELTTAPVAPTQAPSGAAVKPGSEQVPPIDIDLDQPTPGPAPSVEPSEPVASDKPKTPTSPSANPTTNTAPTSPKRSAITTKPRKPSYTRD